MWKECRLEGKQITFVWRVCGLLHSSCSCARSFTVPALVLALIGVA